MNNYNKPAGEVTRYLVSIDTTFYERVKKYSARKRTPLSINVRRWIKEGYMRDKEKDKMDG